MNGTEKFDYEKVKAKMNEIEEYFQLFEKNIKYVNDIISEKINVGYSSAVQGEVGNKILKFWEENAQTFDQFHNNFCDWSNAVTQISMNNQTLESDAAQIK